MQGAADWLTSAALVNKQSGQDNTSVVVMRYSVPGRKEEQEEKKQTGGKQDEFKKM